MLLLSLLLLVLLIILLLLLLLLQEALLAEALAHLGLPGPPARLAAWCRALGRCGLASAQARELFELMDVDHAGRVAPASFCDAELSREAFAKALRCSVDLSHFLLLRYRLLLLGCEVGLRLALHSTPGPRELVAAGLRLRLVLEEADAAAFLREVSAGGGGGCRPGPSPAGGEGGAGAGADAGAGAAVSVICHRLVTLSTSAASVQRCALLPERQDPRQTPPGGPGAGEGAQPAPPPAYVGLTPIEIVVRFKDAAAFPWGRLPDAVCGRPFEELRPQLCLRPPSFSHRLVTAFYTFPIVVAEQEHVRKTSMSRVRDPMFRLSQNVTT